MWPYLGLFLLSAGESSAFLGLAVPGETFVFAAGALAARGTLEWPWVVVVVTVGAIVGDSVGYSIGRRFGGGRDRGWLGRIWSCQRMAHVRRFMDRWGGSAIFVGRFVGLLRPLAPFAAGAVRMPYRPFLAYNVAGAVVWAGATVAVGYFTGTAAAHLLHSFGVVMGGGAAMVTLGVLGLRRARRSARSASVTPTEQDPEEVPS